MASKHKTDMPNIPNSSPHENVPPAGKPLALTAHRSGKKLDLYSEFLRNRHDSFRAEEDLSAR
jgi:hypothetical protein